MARLSHDVSFTAHLIVSYRTQIARGDISGDQYVL